MKRAILEGLLAAQREKRPVALITEFPGGEQRLVGPSDWEAGGAEMEAVREAVAHDASRRIEADGTSAFVQPFNPPLRMIIVGAVHIAQPLSRMAAESGFEVTIVDPRASFATEERFPGVKRCDDWPDEALRKLAPDARTAIVTLTHDPKLDDPALDAVLRAPVFYIGSLGSRKTHAKRVDRLREAGFNDDEIARISGPIGLDIGAKSPAEIAVSILAEVIERLRTPP